jgi:hypothetical protein
MPKKDLDPPHAGTLNDLLTVGKIRNPRNLLKGLVGVRFTMNIQVERPKNEQ